VDTRKTDAANETALAGGSGGRETGTNFIREIVEQDLQEGTYGGRVVTRFPPEPNGYLHIGHAKSIVLNFGVAEAYQGVCNLRMDDTNPETEDVAYVASIKESVHWLGYDWGNRFYYASDYFEQLYQYAVKLVEKGLAYVDSLSDEEIRQYRGTVTEPGRPSPYRDRSGAENLALFEQMRAGAFPDGAHVLRAKIDLASENMKLRDPLLYRIRHAHHYRSGDDWCIYPMYDFAHPLSDAIEGITHSLCTLEFDNNRALYDWVLENCLEPEALPQRPHQYEFARLNLDYAVMSKRKLLQLVEEGLVDGWDDPRMPTILGLRRRGVTPEAIRDFCERIGVTKVDSRVDISLLEHSIRDDLNYRAPRVMGVLRPLKVVITNYPEGDVEWLDAPHWPHDVPREGTRLVPFSRVLYIEQDDFMEDPPKKFYRLAPGREVRLRYAYIIRCDEVVKDPATGDVVELRCSYDPATRSGEGSDGRRVKGTVHWVSAAHALPAEVRLYDRLFSVPNPDEGPEDFKAYLNPNSVETVAAFIEPSVASDPAGTRYQFERQGYFWQDPVDSVPGRPVFNRIVALRDSWAKIAQRNGDKGKGGKGKQDPEAAPRPPKETVAKTPPKATASEPEPDPVAALAPEQKARFDHYTGTLGLDRDDALILADDLALAEFYEEALAAYQNPAGIANWVIHELKREIKDTPLDGMSFGPAQLAALVRLIDEDVISSRIAKDVFAEMVAQGGDPAAIVAREGLTQVADPDVLAPVVDRVLAAHADKAEQYRAGKAGLLGFFVGQVMRETQGRANPELTQELVRSRLG
jgi:glutaminyl-tRNA synthetase